MDRHVERLLDKRMVLWVRLLSRAKSAAEVARIQKKLDDLYAELARLQKQAPE